MQEQELKREPDDDFAEGMDGSNPVVCSADRKLYNPSVNQNNNRLNTSEDFSYDSTGNTTNDPQGRVFKYDGENKQYEVRNSVGKSSVRSAMLRY